MKLFDIIGDIHGYCTRLEELLIKMGYEKKNKAWRHPERKAIFVGDYIDRGPEIKETLKLVRNMVEADSALALMGNHEFNALAYHTPDGENGYLRPHSTMKTNQHGATLAQFYYHQDEFRSCLEWMRRLPLTFETDQIRCVHACWDNQHIKQLNKIVENGLTPELLQMATNKNHEYHVLFEEVLKGKEIDLPNGQSFLDKDGHRRDKVRVQWWLDPNTLTYHQYSISDLPESEVLSAMVENVSNPLVYHSDEIPVFFGHYWLRGRPHLMRDNVCCLDFSVAKEGYLAAYRWEGEKRLSQEHFVYV